MLTINQKERIETMDKQTNSHRDGFQTANAIVNVSQLVTNGAMLALQIVGLFRNRSNAAKQS